MVISEIFLLMIMSLMKTKLELARLVFQNIQDITSQTRNARKKVLRFFNYV